ncbi:hypothetical protein ERHA55_24670 [Erwinia rhapontici]|nr:hypothetical protein ERHA55_24670 [Erwinia rhapontici]
MNQVDVRKETLEINKLQKRLRRNVGTAITDYNMIEDNDVVMVCMSGGKDSFAMLDILLGLQKVAPIKFEIIAVNLDQKQPGFPEHILPAYLDSLNIPYYIVDKDTYSVVKEKVPEGKRPVAYVRACVAARFIPLPRRLAQRKSRWATIWMTSLRRCSLICSMVQK